jgi:DNA polymerase III subunit delta'
VPVLTLAELIGQPDAQDFLRRTVRGRRFSTAYLFHGPPGVGKGTAAFAFARAMLCEHIGGAAGGATPQGGLFDAAPTSAPAAPLEDACGRCAACLKAAALQHPDLKFLFPVSGEEKELDESIKDTLEGWRQDPLFVFVYEKAASIRLSLTRELLRELAFKPYEAARRVVVVRDADRMREDQYSAMLKAIEEPGASTTWVLTTSRPLRLPATVRSRTQRVRFVPFAEPLIAEFLEQRAGASDREARMLAALSGGSLGRALVLRDTQPLESRNQALALLEPAMRGDGAGLLQAVQGYNRLGRAGRETLKRLIEFQELWLRDLLRARYGAAREALVNRDREAEIRRLAEKVDATEIRRRLLVLEEAARSIEGNITPDLALYSAIMRYADRGLETDEWPAHDAGRWRY